MCGASTIITDDNKMKNFTIILMVLITMTIETNAQWVQMSNGIGNNHLVSCLASSGNYLHAGVSVANGLPGDGMYVSIDNGESWIAPDSLTGCYLEPQIGLVADGSNVYVTTSYFVWVSSDNGSNWWQPNGNHNEVTRSLTICGNYILAGYYSGVFRSGNNGADWIFIPNSIDSNYFIGLATSGNSVFATTKHENWGSGKILMSNDFGYSWSEKFSITADYFTEIYISGNIIIANAAYGGMYLSTDLGNTWTQKQSISGSNIMNAIITENIVFAQTSSSLYFSEDTCATWTEIFDGLPLNTFMLSLTIANNYVFIGTLFNSVWRRSLSEIIGIDKIISKTKSSSVFPNPANEQLTITYPAHISAPIELNIFNTFGQQVFTRKILNETVTTLDVSKFSEGFYFIHATKDKQTIFDKKILIVR
jgi:photosystem II stability/assembly factor-like uncharacterized protein